MKRNTIALICAVCMCMTSVTSGVAEKADVGTSSYNLNVNVDNKTIDVSDMLNGLFFEDINHGADGGLYSELIENNSFEYKDSLESWKYDVGSDGSCKVLKDKPLNENNTSYLEMTSTDNSKVSIINDGYKGINIEKGKKYDFYFFANNSDSKDHDIKIELVNENGISISDVKTIRTNSNSWTKYETQLTGTEDVINASIKITACDAGTVDLDMVSLFPSADDTWHQRKFGLRKDLVERLKDLNAKFLRFPGGCVIEGDTQDEMYNWKNTIGKIEERKAIHNKWGYYQSYGLGFYEYFQLCEDLNLQPVPVLNCGMTCQGGAHNGKSEYMADGEELDSYIQDALDLVEYANGSVDTEWGKKRAEAGHPEPFNLKYIEIGNEQWGEDYQERFEKFQKVFKEKYPDIQLISNVGPVAEGAIPKEGWEWVKDKANDTYVDEHYYMSPEWFASHTNRYDSYNRNDAKVYLGEYAAQSNTLKAALAEGAYLTGIEKNSDIVKMESYAPLFAKSDDFQWSPNMIWFNGKTSYGSANYYMQKLFGDNLGTSMLEDKFTCPDISKSKDIKGGVCLGAWATEVQYDNLKVTNNDTGEEIYNDNFDSGDLSNYNKVNGNWTVDNGKLTLKEIKDNCRIDTIANDWTNYTVEVDAKKLGGNEGFLLGFGVKDSDNYFWYNIGGWANTLTAVEQATGGSKSTISTADSKYGTIETGKDYKLKVVVSGKNIKCYLNSELTNEAVIDASSKDVFTSSSYDSKTNEVILKVINTSDSQKDVNINLSGDKKLSDTASVQYITSDSEMDMNSFEDPEKISIKTKTIDNVSNKFTFKAEKYSANVIRIKLK
ncbi:MAG TPA: alpha-arabinofuranosidase [Clostridium sp.]|nr:alpha-arabinofuranosidase [Clostridium sp.]